MDFINFFNKYKEDIKKNYIQKQEDGELTTNISKIVTNNIIGELYYRDISINELLENNKDDNFLFEKTIFLLLFGFIPKKADQLKYNKLLNSIRYSYFNSNYDKVNLISKNMMINIESNILTLYEDDSNADNISFENVFLQCNNIIAKIQGLIFLLYNKNINNHVVLPKKNISTAEFILYLVKGKGKYSNLEIKILDIMLFLHAEHGGGNNSTYTNYVVTTSGTDTYSSIVASLASLKGRRHGGANLKVLEMIECFKNKYDNRSKENIEKYLFDILDKKEFDKSGLIYGLGHAVYRGEDPRTRIIKKYAMILARENNKMEEYRLYCNIENIAKDVLIKRNKYEKNICVNVDFYSALVYSLMEIPKELSIPIFAFSRIVGWSAHRLETIANQSKLVRPKF